MPKFEIELDEKTSRRAEEYAAAFGLTVEDIVANILQSRVYTPPGREDWEPFANPLGMVRLVLLIHWNPIGVAGFKGAMDEYDSYAEVVCNLLEGGATQDELIAHLRGIAKDRMGLSSDYVDLPAVAKNLQAIYKNATRI